MHLANLSILAHPRQQRRGIIEARKAESNNRTRGDHPRQQRRGIIEATALADLGLTAEQLYRWRREFAKSGVTAFSGNGKLSSADEELHRLRRDLKRVTEERDFFKKATAFFAKESR